MENKKKLLYIGLALTAFFALLYVIFVDYISFPWRDELCFTDAPANLSQKGVMWSHVWRYCAPPIHGLFLTGWLFLFGVSHQTVCAFTVFIGLLTCVLLLRILIKREIVTTPSIAAIFVILFWGGYTFSGLLTNGRVDLLAMLFTMLFVNEIIPHNGLFYSQSRWPSVVYAFLVMATYIYTIPITCIFCFILLFIIRDKKYRKELMRRYLWIVGSLIISFILTCLFLVSQHSLFRYLNAFISFNATINNSGEAPSLITRIIDAYRIDLYALLILIGFYILFITKKGIQGIKDNWFPILFVTCIPLIMVLVGRYRVYYSSVFYLPVLALFIWSVSLYNKSKVVISSILAIVLLSAGVAQILKRDYYNKNATEMERVSQFVEASSEYLIPGENVVFNNPKLYYYFFDKDVVLWQKYKGLQEIDSQEEKFLKFVNKKIQSPEKKRKILDIFRQMESPDAYLPSKGLIISDGDEEYQKTIDFMQGHNYHIEKIISNDGFALLKFDRN